MRVKEEGHPNLRNMAMFAFGPAILRRSVWTRNLMMDSKKAEMSLEAIAHEFSTPITLKDLNLARVLIFHKLLKLKKEIKKNQISIS